MPSCGGPEGAMVEIYLAGEDGFELTPEEEAELGERIDDPEWIGGDEYLRQLLARTPSQ
jgi:hypothetical protein